MAEGSAREKVLANVRSHGWYVIYVLPDEGEPGWAYSTGLFMTFGHPEVVMFADSGELGIGAINRIGELVREGSRFEHGSTSAEILEGYACEFRTIPLEQYDPYLLCGFTLYEGEEFPALQCVWPDFGHRFPWEQGYDESLKDMQRLLFDR